MTLPGYTEMSSETRWFPGVLKLVLAFLLFVLTLTTVALYEAGSQRTNTTIHRTSDEVAATVERIARDATNGTKKYYEEQRAVVVNAESMQPVLAQRQDTFGPPVGRSDSFEENPYYDVGDDYGGEQQPADQEAERYYEGLAQESSESVSSESEQWPGSGPEGRAAHERPQDAFYSQWRYAGKPQPPHPSTNMHNRKLEPVAAPHSANRVPYQGYDDLYDYPMEGYRPQPQPQRDVIKPVSSANNNALANGGEGESTLVMILRSLKQMWDLYQALASAWGAIHDHHQQSVQQQKKEQAERQRLREQQKKPRINSKKPPRIEGDKLAQRNSTKKNKGNGSITTAPVTSSTTAIPISASPNTEVAPTKVVQDKGSKGDDAQENEARGLREKRAPEAAATDVGEGRYIKGDPLTGYYDFVITEGSYKFWAAFQVGTALLIIYSTFAAIYYSKVNPLTSDYDYQDYLGGGRSLSGGDDDFVDDSDTTEPVKNSRISNWLPRTAHSLKFILDAIDKLPLDEKSEPGWSTSSKESVETR